MKSPIVMAVAAVLILGGGFFAYRMQQSTKTEYEHELGLDRIRREYLERSALAHQLSDPARYGDEQRALFKWYVGELTDHYNKFAEFKNYERFMDDLLEKQRKKRVKPAEFQQYEARYELVKDLWDRMGTGKYEPVYTAQDKGLRFDVWDVKAVPGDEPLVRVAFALYGAQRRWSEEKNERGRVRKLTVNADFQEVLFKGMDAADKLLGEASAKGVSFSVDDPERFIEEFPPSIVIGYYDLPRFPATVAKGEMTIKIGTRSVLTGENFAAVFVWRPEMTEEWKMDAGLEWKNAEERVVEPPEE